MLLIFLFSFKNVEMAVTYLVTIILDLGSNNFSFQTCFINCPFLEMVEYFTLSE